MAALQNHNLIHNHNHYLFFRDEDELLNTQCPQNLELRWQAEVSSSIYATPLIADINRSLIIFIFVVFIAAFLVFCIRKLGLFCWG